MTEVLPSVVLLGFFLGMRHATDPDHVIAVGTIVSREPTVRGAALIGVIWGIGHSLTILVVGGAIVVLGLVIPPRLGLGMELSVGVMLIVLGGFTVGGRLWRIAGTSGTNALRHDHPHTHGEYVHRHVHGHALVPHGHGEDATPLEWLDRRFRALGLYQVLRPFVVGVVHGLAGSAAVALLVVAAIPSPLWALVYLLVFGLGTVAGMVLVTVATALPFVYAGQRVGMMHRYLVLTSGALSFAFGLFLIYRTGVVDGLFTAHPHWTPG